MHPKNNILNKYLDSKICLHNFFARLFFYPPPSSKNLLLLEMRNT